MRNISTDELLDHMAAGEVRKRIAADCGLSASTLYVRIHRHMKANGIRTVEQAVALRVAHRIGEKLKERLSALDCQALVDEVLQVKK